MTQHCNMFQICIFRNLFYNILIQCSHSRHANIQTWGYNCNKTKLVCIDAKYHIYQNFLKCPKIGKHELHAIVYAKETEVKYTCYSLTSRDPFLKLFSLATMSCVHFHIQILATRCILSFLKVNEESVKLKWPHWR